MIENLKQTYSLSEWILFVGFNEIRVPEDIDGHGTFDQIGVNAFNIAVNGMNEIDPIGGRYTWSN